MKEFTEDDPEYTNEFVSRDSAAKLLPKQDENISIQKRNGGMHREESKVSIKVEMPGQSHELTRVLTDKEEIMNKTHLSNEPLMKTINLLGNSYATPASYAYL